MSSHPICVRSDGALLDEREETSEILSPGQMWGKGREQRHSHTQRNFLRNLDFRGMKGSESLRRGGKIIADQEGVRQLRVEGHKALAGKQPKFGIRS